MKLCWLAFFAAREHRNAIGYHLAVIKVNGDLWFTI